MEATPTSAHVSAQQLRTPFRTGVRRALGVVLSFASLNMLGRLLQMAAAFIVVRSMAKTDYAWYSLANNLVGALTMFTITGISTGLMPLAGEAAHDPVKLGSILTSAGRFRAALLFFGAIVGLPVFVNLLLHSQCSLLQTSLLVLAALVSVMVNIAGQIIATPLNLARRYNIPQWESIMNSTLRLVLVAAFVFAGLADAVTVMIITVLSPLPTMFGWMLPKSRAHVAYGQEAVPATTQRLRKHFIVGLPTSLTYLFEAQIASFIIGYIGSLDKVADLGAISRVALILQVPIAVVTGVLLPRMSAEQDGRRLFRMWVQSSGLALVFGAFILLCGWLSKTYLLMLLGPEYAGLEGELVNFLAFQVFAFFVTVVQTPIQSKGWVRHSWVRPVFVFGSQALAASLLDLSTVHGAIGLMWAGSIGNMLLNGFLLFNGWRGRASL